MVETVVEATSTGTSRPRRLPLLLPNLILVVPVREMIPDFVPLAAGVKLTPMVAVRLGGRTSGMLGPVMANPDPTIEALVMVMVPIPGLETVTDLVWVFPTGTLPKLMLLGFRVIPLEGCCWSFLILLRCGELALRAEQPSMVVRVSKRVARVLREPKFFTGASTNAVRPYGRGFTCWLRHSEVQSPRETETWNSAAKCSVLWGLRRR